MISLMSRRCGAGMLRNIHRILGEAKEHAAIAPCTEQ